MMVRWLSGLSLMMFLLFIVPEVKAVTLRVPQDFTTIQAAYEAANNGDRILVAPGSFPVCLYSTKKVILEAEYYATQTSDANKHSVLTNSCSKPVSFQTSLGDFQTADHWELLGFVLNGGSDGVSYENAGTGIVRYNIINRQSDDPIDIDNVSEVLIEDNILKDGTSGGDGIENRLHSYSGRDVLMIIRNNIIINSKMNGIQLIYQGSSPKRKYLIVNNLIMNSGQVGLGTSDDSNQNTSGYPFQEKIYVLNNTFVNNGGGGMLGGSNLIAHNNIFVNNQVAALKNLTGNSVASHNLFYGNPIDYENSNIVDPNYFGDPRFSATNAPIGFSSYQLGSGSPGIDSGKVVDSFYTEFGLTPPGYSGSAPDLGWIESGGNGAPSATPLPDQVSAKLLLYFYGSNWPDGEKTGDQLINFLDLTNFWL